MLRAPLAALLVGAQAASAQSASPPPLPIQDNSFLVEEAYNQGRGIVQHISTFARPVGGVGGWAYNFTQEWPAPAMRHQFSYSVPVTRAGPTEGSGTRIGDIAVNYRYQIGNDVGDAIAFAPRATLLLPTGPRGEGQPFNGTGFQFNLPLSVVLPAGLVAHSNVGATWITRARDGLGNSAATQGYYLGQSLVWLAHPKLNFMLEAAWNRFGAVAGAGRTVATDDFLLAPGLRGAIDFSSGLQIVPGVAFPIGIGPSRGDRSVFVYFSLEHPFARQDP